MENTEEQIRERLVAALLDSGLEERKAKDAAFHMTDWFEDLKQLWRTFDEIGNLGDDEITAVVYRFLAHVPNHLAAASKLTGMGPVSDIFGIGVLEEDED